MFWQFRELIFKHLVVDRPAVDKDDRLAVSAQILDVYFYAAAVFNPIGQICSRL
jgi:hypothetical protein